MDVLGCIEFIIARYIQKNSDNLTKAAAMQVIREVTGMGDGEILESEKVDEIDHYKKLISMGTKSNII